MNIKQALPWQAKIIAKIILSRLPFTYRIWQYLSLFKHGDMEKPEYAHHVFTTHFERVDFQNKNGAFTALEIGPGDTLFSAMITHAYGATQCYLVDVGRFAREDTAPYRAMANELSERGLPIQHINDMRTVEDLLSKCNAQYLTDGLRSLKTIPDHSVDFVWSQAVLEHIRVSDFFGMMKELHRVLRHRGVCSHSVDLKDHLGGALNNLRFSSRVWESDFMAHSGFYTNRINYSKMLGHFKAAGFSTEVIHVDRWSHLPTPRAKLAPEFRGISNDELLISSFDVILRPR